MDRLRALLGASTSVRDAPAGDGGGCPPPADGADGGGGGSPPRPTPPGGGGGGSPSPSPTRRGFPSPRSLRSLTPPRGGGGGSVSPRSGRWGGGGKSPTAAGGRPPAPPTPPTPMDVSFPLAVTHTAHGGDGGSIAGVGDAPLAPSVVAAARASGVPVTGGGRAVAGAVWRTYTEGLAPPCGEGAATAVAGGGDAAPRRPVLGEVTPAQARSAAAAAAAAAAGGSTDNGSGGDAVAGGKGVFPPPAAGAPPPPPVRYIHADPRTVFDLTEVGAGASGKVYRAVRRTPSAAAPTVVALKAVHPSTPVEAAAVASEAAALGALNHPHVVSGSEAYAWRGGVWMAMQWMDAGCLTDVLGYLQRRRLLLEEGHIAYVLGAAVAGLGALHAGRRLHRDLKSDNLLLDGGGGVRVADYGFCVELTDERRVRSSVVGTPFWMAPELIRGSPYAYAADVWSLGILAIEAAEWSPPHMAQEPLAAMLTISTSPPPRLRHAGRWSPEFGNFVARCLQADPAARAGVGELAAHPFLRAAYPRAEVAALFRYVRDARAAEAAAGGGERGVDVGGG